MSRIIYLMGKSSSGKDTIFKRLQADKSLGLRTVVTYTTRPIRIGEKNGVEYFFTDEDGYLQMKEQGKIIEDRAYETYHGVWRYFTALDGQIENDGPDYIMIGTLEAYHVMCSYFGAERMLPVMIELDDGIRLQRALKREMSNASPKYQELCRRYLADCEDYSEDKIKAAGITKCFENDDLERCLAEISAYINETKR